VNVDEGYLKTNQTQKKEKDDEKKSTLNGSTPVVNAVSLVLIFGVSMVALINFLINLKSSKTDGT
jgi:hypothetical protein